MSATINGRKIAAMSYGGQKIASAWMGGRLVWSGVQPSSNEVREWVFPNNTHGDILISKYLEAEFGGALGVASGDMIVSGRDGLGQLSLTESVLSSMSNGEHYEPIIVPSAAATPGAASEWIGATKITSAGIKYSSGFYPSGGIRLFVEADDGRYVGVQLSTNAASCGATYSADGGEWSFVRSSVSTKLPSTAGGSSWGDLTMWYKDGKLRYYRNFSLLGEVELPFRMDNMPVKPGLYLEATKSATSKAPPRTEFLAVYTGTEAASRASIWGLGT